MNVELLTTPHAGEVVIPISLVRSTIKLKMAIGLIPKGIGYNCFSAIVFELRRIDSKYEIQDKDLELIIFQDDYFVSAYQVQGIFNHAIAQNVMKFNEPKHRLYAEKAAIFKVASLISISLIGSRKLLSAIHAVSSAYDDKTLLVAKTKFIEALEENILNVQNMIMKQVISEVGEDMDFLMKGRKMESGAIRFIGKHKTLNQAIISEIHISTEKGIYVHNEIINCDNTIGSNLLKQFNKSIKQKGITIQVKK